MVTAIDPLREQLLDRRQRLEDAVGAFHEAPNLTHLLEEVDAALERMDDGTYGLCDLCHEPVETDRLIADPLTRLCIGHLTQVNSARLKKISNSLLAFRSGCCQMQAYRVDGWEVAYHYQRLDW